MNELVKIDDSTYYDPSTGEEYFYIDGFDWHFIGQDRKNYISRQLENTIEAFVLARLGEDWEVPSISIPEYFNRIGAFRPSLINEGGLYTEFCDKIALDALSKDMHCFTGNTWSLGIQKIKLVYEEQLNKIVDELVEYRKLRQTRFQLNREDLIKHLQVIFNKKVSISAGTKFKSVKADLEAELSLCLTDIEKEDLLRVEYRTKLATYKEKAKTSAVANINFEFIPWQCFTSQYLSRCCSDFILGHITWHPYEIDFDLTLINYWSQNEFKVETSNLAAEWLVIEWIKGEINGNVSTVALTSKNEEEVKQTEKNDPRQQNEGTQRKARIAVTRFESLLNDAVVKERGKKSQLPTPEVVKGAIVAYMQSTGLNIATTEKGLNRYLKDSGINQTALKYGGQVVRQLRANK